ncbi:hypothetical protein LVD15_21375 [Fulvivirga maritima]|uniref:hypothetical protein n=1 Tax=Fulvivirga maritima TaxID=2904247 RepID=UPI001F1CFFB2|nr:hypothetical protein [Fulvivirga maritima]UII25828.1 hypothetical protein LVD15_21375 [Fulvivirga maritima]
MKQRTKAFIIPLFVILIIQGFFYLVLDILFLFDTIAVRFQIPASILHLAATFIVYWLLIRGKNRERSSYWIVSGIAIIFICLNAIPIKFDFNMPDNGFIPMYTQVYQTILGWPFPVLRLFSAAIEIFHKDMGHYLIHFDHFFLNLYLLSVIIAIAIYVINRFSKSQL